MIFLQDRHTPWLLPLNWHVSSCRYRTRLPLEQHWLCRLNLHDLSLFLLRSSRCFTKHIRSDEPQGLSSSYNVIPGRCRISQNSKHSIARLFEYLLVTAHRWGSVFHAATAFDFVPASRFVAPSAWVLQAALPHRALWSSFF